MLYAGNNLARAREVFIAAIKHRPRISLTITARPSAGRAMCLHAVMPAAAAGRDRRESAECYADYGRHQGRCCLSPVRVPAIWYPSAETRTRRKPQFIATCVRIGIYGSPVCQVSRHLGCNDQNSAGRYPLISRPMHTSTSVGVVHNMSALPLLVVGQDPFILNAPPPP